MNKQAFLTIAFCVATTAAAWAQQRPSRGFDKGHAANAQAGWTAPASRPLAAVRKAAAAGHATATALSGTMSASQNIVENLNQAPEFTSLIKSLELAAMVPQLQGNGPYTVFAPSNKAFEKLSEADRQHLWAKANKQELVALVRSHVVPGDLKVRDLMNGQFLTTLSGSRLLVHRTGNQVQLEDANGNRVAVAAADLPSSNGTIHGIETLLAGK